MLIPEIAPYIKDNNNCKSHGKDMYIQMVEYSYYTGEYDKDTNTFLKKIDIGKIKRNFFTKQKPSKA